MRKVRVRRSWGLYLIVFALSVLATTWLSSLMVSARNSERAADRAEAQARAQASIVAGQRAAQSRRIDALSHQLATARAQVAQQARVIGRQEQAIRDLAAQVDQMGGRPVASPVSTATRKPLAAATTGPTTAPTPATTTTTSKPRASSTTSTTSSPKPQPAPTTTQPHDDGPLGVCVLLPLC